MTEAVFVKLAIVAIVAFLAGTIAGALMWSSVHARVLREEYLAGWIHGWVARKRRERGEHFKIPEGVPEVLLRVGEERPS